MIYQNRGRGYTSGDGSGRPVVNPYNRERRTGPGFHRNNSEWQRGSFFTTETGGNGRTGHLVRPPTASRGDASRNVPPLCWNAPIVPHLVVSSNTNTNTREGRGVYVRPSGYFAARAGGIVRSLQPTYSNQRRGSPPQPNVAVSAAPATTAQYYPTNSGGGRRHQNAVPPAAPAGPTACREQVSRPVVNPYNNSHRSLPPPTVTSMQAQPFLYCYDSESESEDEPPPLQRRYAHDDEEEEPLHYHQHYDDPEALPVLEEQVSPSELPEARYSSCSWPPPMIGEAVFEDTPGLMGQRWYDVGDDNFQQLDAAAPSRPMLPTSLSNRNRYGDGAASMPNFAEAPFFAGLPGTTATLDFGEAPTPPPPALQPRQKRHGWFYHDDHHGDPVYNINGQLMQPSRGKSLCEEDEILPPIAFGDLDTDALKVSFFMTVLF
jgi:hypothetical protein